ncbi:MAG: FAD-binding oxidoreductase [Calothrix sp. MO_192.B10]|nr:FAD-binding oxidoreductase [Calothrix sp. MO_192.B10]
MKAMSNDKTQSVYASCMVSIVGEDNAVDWENITPSMQTAILDAVSPGITPSCIVYPRTQAELGAVVTEAYRNQWRILICGRGSKLHWGGLAQGVDVVISTARLNQIIDHAVGDLTVTVEAGMKLAELQQILAANNQFLALDPTYPDNATIGGIIATADTGSLRQRYGSVRDQILGITFVRSDGEIVKAGGRVVKNVAGYDLMKLFTGSYGTLGAIAQVTFRLYPIPPASQTIVLTGDVEAISQAADILRSSALTPTQADLISEQLLSSLAMGKGLGLIVRFQTIPESITEQSKQLLNLGEKLGLNSEIHTGSDEAYLWQRLRESIHNMAQESAITCKIGVLPTAATKVLTQGEMGIIHIASGLGILQFASEKGVLDMRTICESQGGFLSILSAPTHVKEKIDIWGYTGNALSLMQGIKQQFDSKNIFSTGRFVSGI